MESLILKRINTHGLLRKVSLQTIRSRPRPSHKNLLLSSSSSSSSINIINAQAASTKTWRRRFSAFSAVDSDAGSAPPKRRPRRKKQKYEQFSDAKLATGQMPTTTSSLENPFQYSGDSIDEYKKKTELSPWVPLPDSAARKIFDRAIPEDYDSSDKSKEGEVHVELGSGDGRVNFHAIEYGVSESIGIEVDEDVVKLAEERLARIHPKPNLKFIVSDLMDPNSPAWQEHVPKATILTMYFAKDGLQKIRPYLEQALRGKKCKIFTCGYPMPGWDSQIVETVLDLPIHFYDWGNESVNMMVLQPSDSIVDSLPQGTAAAPSDNMDQYMGRKNKKSTFVEDPLPGYHPDDLIDYGWMDDFNEKEEENKEEEDGNTTKTKEERKPSRIEMLRNFKPPTK